MKIRTLSITVVFVALFVAALLLPALMSVAAMPLPIRGEVTGTYTSRRSQGQATQAVLTQTATFAWPTPDCTADPQPPLLC